MGNWNLAGLEGIAIQELDDTLIDSEFLQNRTGSAVGTRAGTDTA